jgi:pimeloyl-ACP methyl ester carboxylesterase
VSDAAAPEGEGSGGRRGVSRRTFVIGAGIGAVVVAAGGVALVENGVVPGKARLNELLGRGGEALPPPGVEPGPVVTGTFESAARRTEVGWTAIYPPGAEPGDRLPVCLFLHGRNGHHTDAAGPRHLDRFLAGAVDEGAVTPFVIVAVDGGDAVNWHRRANGDDPPAMIRSELLPLLADRGLDVERPALWGVSLGGYGALYYATLPDTEVSAVAALSPALWKHPGEWREGTFDDDADFAATNVWDRRDRVRGIPLRIDCGASDPFVDRVREFRGSLDPTPAGGIEEGGHDGRYWSRQTPAELAFIGQALRR